MELGDIIVTIGRILNNLEKIQEEKGVPNTQQNLIDNNINNSSLGKKREPTSLSSNEKKKAKELFSLFNESFFAYQKKQKEDTTQQTLVSKLERENKPRETAPTDKKKKGFNLLDFLLPLVGGVALIGAAIPTLIASLFEKVGFAGDAMKVLGKIGLIGGLKLLGTTFLKRFSIMALKRIPYVGGLISLGFAIKEFKAGRIIPGLIEIVSGLANFVPFVGPILSIGVDVLKAFLEKQGAFNEGGALSNTNAWGTIKGWMSSIGTWIWDNALYIPIVGTFKRFGMAWDAFGSGDWKEGLKQTLYGLISIIPGGGFLIKGYEWLSSYLSSSKEEQQAQINEGGVMGTIKGWISGIGQFISDNAMNLPIIGGIKRFGMAWDAFAGGNIGEGFKLLGEGVLAFVGGGPLVSGFNMLAGWLLGGEKEDEKSLSPDGSWKDRLKNWIKGKLHKLPAFLRKPLEWFGILDETDKESGDNATVSSPNPKQKINNNNVETEENKGFFSKMADSIGSGLKTVGDIAGGMFSSLKDLGKNAFDTAFKKFSEILPELEKTAGEMIGKLSNTLSTALPEIGSKLSNIFGGVFDSLSNTLSTALPEIGSKLSNILNNLINSKMFDNIEFKNIFSGIIPDIKLMLLSAFEQLSQSIASLSNDINNQYKPIVKTQNDKEYLDKAWNYKLKEHQKIKEKLTGKDDNAFQSNKSIITGQKKENLTEKNDNIFKNNEAISVGQIIEQASSNECKYLEALVNIGNLTLKEMRKASGSGSGVSVIPQAPTVISSSNKSKIPLIDNRIGYADSVYTFG